MVQYKKIKNLILYLTSNKEITDLGKTKLYKLFFFIDSLSYKRLGYKITGDKYLKFPMGPVPVSVPKLLQNMENNSEILVSEKLIGSYFITTYTPKIKADMSVFSEDEIKLIDAIISKYGNLNRQELISQSHEMESWIKAKDYAEMDFSEDNVIPSPAAFAEEYKSDIEALSKE